jgi:methyltransferase-like protein 6
MWGVGDYWQQKYRRDAGKAWNVFYRRNETRFFRDRHWTLREFPEVAQAARLLEIGCGVGNFLLPLIDAFGKCHEEQQSGRMEKPDNVEQPMHMPEIYGCDIAPRAIELLQADPRYQAAVSHIQTAVWNVTDGLASFPFGGDAKFDLVVMVFVLSAIAPELHGCVFSTVNSLLSDGGLFFLRDYAADDAAQARFAEDRRLGDRFYVRQDGTFAYYFGADELQKLATDNQFMVEEVKLVQRETVNHKLDVHLDRRFVQCKFRKSL